MQLTQQQGNRRQSKGAAWHWRQTDAWYYTPPGTKQRVPLRNEQGRRIRGKDQKQAAELALARLKVAGQWRPTPTVAAAEEWLVARVCSGYLEYCATRVAKGTLSARYRV